MSFTDDGGTDEELTSDAYPASGTVEAALNAAPSFTSPEAFDAAENQTAAGTVQASDGDSGDSLTGYAIEGGADQSGFSIVAATGVLTFILAPNFEAATDADGGNDYVVVVRASSGTGARVQTADQTITVTDEDEQPATPGAPMVMPTVGSATRLDVSRTEPDRAGGPEISGYKLRYQVTGTSGWLEDQQPSGTGTTLTLMELTPTQATRCRCRRRTARRRAHGRRRGAAGSAPPPPHRASRCSDNDTAQVTGVLVEPGKAQLVVSWTAVDNAMGYKVQWKSGNENYDANRQATVTRGSSTRHTIGDLANGTEYTVRVIAVRTGANDGPPSEEATGTPVADPHRPGAADADRGGGEGVGDRGRAGALPHRDVEADAGGRGRGGQPLRGRVRAQ